MKPLYFFVGLLFLSSCASLQKQRISSVPLYTDQTSWLSRQYATEYQGEDLSATYSTTLSKTTPTHYHFMVALEGQPQSAYTIRVRRNDLAIDGFLSAREDSLHVYLPILKFPLFKGKRWTETLIIQEHPRSPIKKIPATFEVKEIGPYDYLPQENLPAEKKAFLIVLTLPKQIHQYYYLPPGKNFPGTNPVDIYLQLDLINTNAPKMKSEALEYVR